MSARWAAVIGDPVAHSLSPLMHNAWLEQAGLDGEYRAIRVLEHNAADEIRALLDAPACCGVNVTLPHKETALAQADEASDSAAAIGAANTLTLRSGRIYADNTDEAGFIDGLRRQAPGLSLTGARVLILGAGGAARAAVYALNKAGARVKIANRTRSRAEALAEALGGDAVSWPPRLDGETLIVNATAVGLDGVETPLPSFDGAAPDAAAYDLIYNPLETPFLRAARAEGLTGIDGLDMLIGQARPAFKAFFGAPPPDIDMRALLLGERGL